MSEIIIGDKVCYDDVMMDHASLLSVTWRRGGGGRGGGGGGGGGGSTWNFSRSYSYGYTKRYRREVHYSSDNCDCCGSSCCKCIGIPLIILLPALGIFLHIQYCHSSS